MCFGEVYWFMGVYSSSDSPVNLVYKSFVISFFGSYVPVLQNLSAHAPHPFFPLSTLGAQVGV